jgi:hypothetical protein
MKYVNKRREIEAFKWYGETELDQFPEWMQTRFKQGTAILLKSTTMDGKKTETLTIQFRDNTVGDKEAIVGTWIGVPSDNKEEGHASVYSDRMFDLMYESIIVAPVTK